MRVMCGFKVLLICVYVLSVCSHSSTVENIECRKINGCICVLSNGMRLDLTQLTDEAKWLNATLRDTSFFFHPCSDIPYGTHTGSDDCSSGSSKLRLESVRACPAFELPAYKTISQNSNKGLSTGSVLVIVFFVFTILYFVGGAVALKFLRGAQGREMIPNYDFWVDLPNLVRWEPYDKLAINYFPLKKDLWKHALKLMSTKLNAVLPLPRQKGVEEKENEK